MKKRLQFLVLLGLGAGVCAHADVVTDWNKAALDATRADRTPPPWASRDLAILLAAIYDAVNGISRAHKAYFVQSAVPASASKEGAASAAAHAVLISLYPAKAADFDRVHAATLRAIRNGPQKDRGIAWGEAVAAKILAWRADDGADAMIAPPGESDPGDWVPTPPAFAAYLLPQWGDCTPFAMPDELQFRPPGPPALDSAKWASAYNEVKALGAAVGSSRTPDQTEIALQTPKTKLQRSSKSQAPRQRAGDRFWNLNFSGAWCLGFGGRFPNLVRAVGACGCLLGPLTWGVATGWYGLDSRTRSTSTRTKRFMVPMREAEEGFP